MYDDGIEIKILKKVRKNSLIILKKSTFVISKKFSQNVNKVYLISQKDVWGERKIYC